MLNDPLIQVNDPLIQVNDTLIQVNDPLFHVAIMRDVPITRRTIITTMIITTTGVQ